MKRILLAAIALAAVACTRNSVQLEAETELGPYTITNFSSGIYHIQDYNAANPAGESFDAEGNKTHFNNCSDMYLLVGKTDALLIDLSNKVTWADNAEESLRKLVADRTGELPLTITFTHNHGDHTGMLSAFIDNPDVSFALPQTDFEKMLTRYPDFKGSLYNDGEKFDIGGMKIDAVEVPGHTAGSMVFFVEGRDILISGDAIGSGHGVWIFDLESFKNYIEGYKNLMAYINNEANGINREALRIYGGHYWQKDWFPELGDDTFGIQYINDMQELISKVADGSAETEPSNLDHRTIDTYFRYGQAIIAWNAAFAEQYRSEL